MGCSASQHQPCQNDKNLASFPGSVFVRGSSAKGNGGSPSSSPGTSCSRATAAMDGQYIVKSFSRINSSREEDRLSRPLKGKAHQQFCEHADGLLSIGNFSRKHASSGRLSSLGSAIEFKSEAAVSPFSASDSNENASCMSKLAKSKALCAESRASSFQLTDSLDGSIGLRLLLSPATPSRSFTSSARFGILSEAVPSTSQYFLNQMANARSANKPTTKASLASMQAIQAVKLLPSQVEQMGDSEEIGSPLFDPSILETFEKAIEASSDGDWLSLDAASSNCSRVGCSSSDSSSEAESLYCNKESSVHHVTQELLARQVGMKDNICKVGGDDICNSSRAVPEKAHISKDILMQSNTWVENEHFQGFDMKCPPGCENKIVLYFTSLRGIRKTFEDCCTARLILKGFGVQVDERDVWMHSSFRQELTKLIGAVLVVPRLFVRGRYIGGIEDVIHLHEEGILGYLLDGLPPEVNGKCTMCAGIRFIPCTSCSGSCKVISFGEVLQCPNCNENGLMMCPSCY